MTTRYPGRYHPSFLAAMRQFVETEETNSRWVHLAELLSVADEPKPRRHFVTALDLSQLIRLARIAEYRGLVFVIRARAGTLPPDIELFILEMADGRMPLSVDRAVAEPEQSRTLALIRPLAFPSREATNE